MEIMGGITFEKMLFALPNGLIEFLLSRVVFVEINRTPYFEVILVFTYDLKTISDALFAG